MSTVEQAKSAPVRAGGESGGVTGWWDNSRGFFTEVRNEMRRVTWPAKKEVYATTVVVILVASFFGLYLFGLDLAFTAMVNWLFRQFGAA
jgi:preprotein translocase subunit SecE